MIGSHGGHGGHGVSEDFGFLFWVVRSIYGEAWLKNLLTPLTYSLNFLRDLRGLRARISHLRSLFAALRG